MDDSDFRGFFEAGNAIPIAASTEAIMPPACVKPYVRRERTDAVDAEAICRAMRRPALRYVAITSPEQQAVLALHRTPNLFVKQRNMPVNMICGLLAQFGGEAPWSKNGHIPAFMQPGSRASWSARCLVARITRCGLLSWSLRNRAIYDFIR